MALLASIQELANAGNVRVSAHGFEELASDDITFSEILDSPAWSGHRRGVSGLSQGPCVLVLQTMSDGGAVHVLWGIAKNAPDTATLITAYRPTPAGGATIS